MNVLNAIAGALLFVMLILVLLGLPTMYLWNNSLVPAVTGLSEITFWQAVGINILCSILFKGANATVSAKKD